ncbi:uncharacterized protein LACBIDRAFT_325253 [Laccaria bicolor S238N-H82]|uniref:Predicted protein n=1 Tax=Laccaria bicolor (strain S238N-H82 / ATCC MYA-4686) TaxID=486041 RepID=B0D4B8_LACBS|nr:uncharacterized protein LACBIDRAFT_325253 [Laccaria bicolor S238N-H82]EDR10306.1 predicted protein [Laccaria bicolor S238N-H82]|eukprot:XP_001878756.1 predicted protein [Laccaria bicolor S238N-H82]
MVNTLRTDSETENDSWAEALKTSLLNDQRATLVNELPPELLVHIFEMGQKMFFPLEQHLSWRFPLTLGEVSRYWRQVAYGAPTLWSNVDVSFLRDMGGLRVYLRRSKDSPIDLNITFTPTLRQRDVDTLIGILQPHYRRCRTALALPHYDTRDVPVITDLPYMICHTFFLRKCHSGGELWQLRCRSIRVKAEASYEFTTEISRILDSGHYPMLRHICVDGFDMNLDSQPIAIVADAVNLTSILGHILLLSISAPNLEGLTIAPVIQNDLTKLERETTSSNAPRFPALKSLTLVPAHAKGLGLKAVAFANVCFPGIKLLIFPKYDKLSFLGSFKTTDSWSFWPELDGLAVRDVDDQGPPTFRCALALAVPGSLVNVKNDPNGVVKGSIVGGGGGSVEDTMSYRGGKRKYRLHEYYGHTNEPSYYLTMTLIGTTTSGDIPDRKGRRIPHHICTWFSESR